MDREPSSIAARQNEDYSLTLLAAQRQMYSSGKRARLYGVLGSGVLAIIAPIVLLFFPQYGSLMVIAGGMWFIIVFASLRSQENVFKVAAKVQEEFDVELFRLPWNDILVGPHVTRELIYEASRAFRGDRTALRDWYPEVSNLPHYIGVLVCQRSNIVWEWRLRRGYGWAVAILASILLISGVTLGCWLGETLLNWLFGVFFPSLPAYLYGLETSLTQFRTANEVEEFEERVNELWRKALLEPQIVNAEQCRRIQDRIFIHRRNALPIPDSWYKLLRLAFQSDMRSTVVQMTDEMIRALERTGATNSERTT